MGLIVGPTMKYQIGALQGEHSIAKCAISWMGIKLEIVLRALVGRHERSLCVVREELVSYCQNSAQIPNSSPCRLQENIRPGQSICETLRPNFSHGQSHKKVGLNEAI